MTCRFRPSKTSSTTSSRADGAGRRRARLLPNLRNRLVAVVDFEFHSQSQSSAPRRGGPMKLTSGKLVKPFQVRDGSRFRLKDYDPSDTAGIGSKQEAKALLEEGVARLAELQDKLYAEDHWALLLIFQAMDAAGKDGVIKHVMSGVNPQGCQVYSFKSPSAEELNHDYLWRTMKSVPERGRIGIFNRSYYEEVLVVRVHPEFLKAQKTPSSLVTKDIWRERFEDIRAYER